MNRATEGLLADLLDRARSQLDAARSLDSARLHAATERRHAAIVALYTGPRLDPEVIRPHIEALQQLDVRLVRILNAGDRTLRRVLLKSQQTYDRRGRMSGGRP